VRSERRLKLRWLLALGRRLRGRHDQSRRTVANLQYLRVPSRNRSPYISWDLQESGSNRLDAALDISDDTVCNLTTLTRRSVDQRGGGRSEAALGTGREIGGNKANLAHRGIHQSCGSHCRIQNGLAIRRNCIYNRESLAAG
jgi:hypothetical protein